MAAPCVAIAIASFGLQVIGSVTYTYCADCYKPQTSEVASFFNFVRQVFGCTLAFYSLPFADRVGFQWSFAVYTIICVVFFMPIVWLMKRGEAVRMSLGSPKFNAGL